MAAVKLRLAAARSSFAVRKINTHGVIAVRYTLLIFLRSLMFSRTPVVPLAAAAMLLSSFCLFAPVALRAQAGAPAGPQTSVETGGTVSGTVLDPDAAAIPGATILLTPAKGPAISATSRGDGSFDVQAVPTGMYTFTVTMQGFGSFVKGNVRVGGQPIKIAVKLSIEEQSTTITVTTNENQVSVDPDSNGSAVVVKGADLDALSDDPDELSNELTALAGPAAGPNGGQIYVDGFTGGQLPPKSAIREIRINQNPFSAQYDQPGFGRVEILTKPGTDKLHGQLSVQGMDKSFNTSSPFLGASNIQPDYHQIFFIGSVSGAISKGASFNVAGSHRTIQDNNVFSGRIASVTAGSTALCAPGTVGCMDNAYPDAFRAIFAPRTRYDFTPRIDYAVTDKNTLTARYQFEHSDSQNAGIGGLVLPTAGYNSNSNENNIQISDTQILSAKLINETRFEFRRSQNSQNPLSTAPTVTVTGNFTGGGSAAGTTTSTQDHYEVQNYTSVALAKNFIRAGVRVRTDRTAQFSTQNANGTFSYATVANYLANQPFQYKVATIANPRVGTHLTDIGLYAEDDWKVKPNLTLTYGLRYEAQGTINSNHDIAPRFSANYGVPRKNGNPLTVLRFGYGVFFTRFGLGDVINTLQQNGVNSVVQTFLAPAAGCAPGATAACGANLAAKPITYTLASNLRSEYNSQIALGVDQQLPLKTTLSVTYLNTIGIHQYFSRSLPTTGNNLLYQYQAEGYYRQNQLLLNVRSQVSPKFSFFGFYALNVANSNTQGADSFVTDSLNPRTDYGRFQNRSRLFFFASYSAPFKINLSPFMIANSGTPYNVTAGTDVNGDSIINDRAQFASGVTSASCSNALNFAVPAGTTDTYTRIPQGYCTGPAQFTFNTRIVRAFGFGPKTGAAAGAAGNNGQGGPPPGGGGGNRGGGGGGRGGGFGGGGLGSGSSGHKYTVSLGAQILNLFNNVPYAPQNGNLTAYNPDPAKNLFGKSQSLAQGPFSQGSAVRRIFLQANFSF